MRIAGWPFVAHFTLLTRASKSPLRASNESNRSASPINKPSSSISSSRAKACERHVTRDQLQCTGNSGDAVDQLPGGGPFREGHRLVPGDSERQCLISNRIIGDADAIQLGQVMPAARPARRLNPASGLGDPKPLRLRPALRADPRPCRSEVFRFFVTKSVIGPPPRGRKDRPAESKTCRWWSDLAYDLGKWNGAG